jgi:hypothetical protein
MFDFYKYIETFNAGDDQAMLDNFWVDDLVVATSQSGNPKNGGVLARGKDEWIKFLAGVHDGMRELIRVQTMIQNEDNLFAEIDMDFHAKKDRPDYPFGALKAGDFITVKMFALYFLRGDKIAMLKLASWPPNVGVSDPPTRVFGPEPPIVGKVRKTFD